MKRLFLMIVLVVMVIMVAKSHHRRSEPTVAPPAQWAEVRHRHDGNAGNRFVSEAGDEVRQSLREARDDVRQSLREARDDVRQAFNEVRDEFHQAFNGDDNPWSGPTPPPELEEADGLPVPIVPGSRVTVAQTKPPAPAVPPAPPARRARRKVSAPAAAPVANVAAPVAPSPTRIVKGQISATEERAKADAYNALRNEVLDWLDIDISGAWSPPSRLIGAMIQETRITPVVKEYGTLYVAELKADFSPQKRQAFVQVYHREQVRQRLAVLGGILGFVLICLAAVSGYIRSDEATKGYYTNRLRILTAAGVGAAGVMIYRILV
jgi:hypothetical protein